MKKYISILAVIAIVNITAWGQPNVVPAKSQTRTIAISGATIHIGNGQVIEGGTVVFSQGRIVSVSPGKNIPSGDVVVIDATGKHVYPGIIAPITNLGLAEIAMVKSTVDYRELGEWNPHVRTIIAYNTDSKAIPVVRSNGILMAQVSPTGGTISGQSSIVQLDAWNWEDAAYRTDDGLHFNWPTESGNPALSAEQARMNLEKTLSDFQKYMLEAKAYAELGKADVVNARFESLKGLFNGKKKAYVRAETGPDIIAAIRFFKSLGVTPVIVGGSDACSVAEFLKENSVPIILNQAHSLPEHVDDDVYMPARQAACMQKAGVLYAISLEFVRDWGYLQLRNLPFEAGVAASYGISKEEALMSITSNTAKILGIDQSVGTLEAGKDATLIVSAGDVLDPLTCDVQHAFIRGRTINLDNLHKQLYKKFSDKYELK